MNKTPIQELIDVVNRQKRNRHEIIGAVLESIAELMEAYIEKEKQFAFECFEAGRKHQVLPNHSYNFEQFYSQYAE